MVNCKVADALTIFHEELWKHSLKKKKKPPVQLSKIIMSYCNLIRQTYFTIGRNHDVLRIEEKKIITQDWENL